MIDRTKGIENRIWTKADLREMLRLRATGLTWHDVAKKIGRTEAAVVTRVYIIRQTDDGRRSLAKAEARRP